MSSANRFNGNSSLGVGIGLRVPHYEHIFKHRPKVDFFEIISENFMTLGGRPREVLETLLEDYRVVQHGVSLYFGSREPYDREYLKRLKRLVEITGTPYLSDHLCWGSVNGYQSHDLLPLPYTKEAVKHTAARIKEVRDFLELPVCVENVSSYITYTDSVMSEWQFLLEVSEAADCGILLDVNNIYVSSVNHGFDARGYIEAVPLDRVAQVHLAGPCDRGTYLLDTHDHPVPDPVWSLYEMVVSRLGAVNTLLEWDDKIPPFQEVMAEAGKAMTILDRYHQEGGTDD